MTNKELGAVIHEIAELLELTDVSRFEVIAYQNAARTVEFLDQDIETVYKEKGIEGLQALPGIGHTISKNIAELLDTGESSKKAYLLEKIPAIQLEINNIPGVGPKTTKKLYELLKPKTIADLVKKINTPRYQKKLADSSLKEKTITNILAGIKIREKVSKRLPIGVALPIAEEFLHIVQSVPGVIQADIVGSLRRMKETVGDIDIIASAKDTKKVMNAFASAPLVDRVVANGTAKVSIITKEGIRVDLEVLPKDKYGSLLQHFTGSKEHNVALRTWAVQHNFSISEHGIKQTKNGKTKLITCEKEEEVYKTLGMQWVPPEIREGRGEVEAALSQSIPNLITTKDIKGDLQMHTTASDGQSSILDMALKALDLGYEYIAITDHAIGVGIAGGLDEKGFVRQRKEIDKANQILKQKKKQLTILQGVEVNIKADGTLSLAEKSLKEMDIVVASIHSSFSQSKEQTTKRYLGAIENPNIDIIAHPTGRILGRRDELLVDWNVIFNACLQYDTALEINAALDRLDLPDQLAREAGKRGVRLIISTDAHSPEGLENMRFGVTLARRAWLTKAQISNTLRKEEFIAWLKRK